MKALRTLSLFGGLLLVSLAQADVLVVAPSGAPYTQPQAAVTAAVNGDTILIKPGTYNGFTLNAKALDIIADVEGSVTLNSLIQVQNIGPGQDVLIAGIRYRPLSLRLSACAGSVRLVGLVTLPPFNTGSVQSALELSNCADVAVLRCTLTGAPSFGGFPSNPGVGLNCYQSNVAIYDSVVRGGDGSDGGFIGTNTFPPIAGAAGAFLEGASQLLASKSEFRAGAGGDGTSGYCFGGVVGGGAGAQGGIGLVVPASAQARLLNSTTVGGAGGLGGAGNACGAPPGTDGPSGANTSGIVEILAGPSASLGCAFVVREQNTLNMTVDGSAGDEVFLLMALQSQWSLQLPFQGVQLVGPAVRRKFLGTIGASGSLQHAEFYGELGVGLESRTWHVQALLRDTSGNVRLGSAAVYVVLDSAF